MEYSELILKVSSCCNLNCDYCYVFNKGDFSYKREPNLMSISLIPILLNRIKEHCLAHKLNRFLVIFHGGEPLMQSKDFFIEFVKQGAQSMPLVALEYGVQTNGTLLTQEWIDLFKKLNIQIGISIDGPQEASKHRVYRSNRKVAYDAILRGIKLVKENHLPVCTLSVMNIEYPPRLIYNYLKEIGVDYTDFLYPDITYDEKVNDNFSKWIIELFDCWYEDLGNRPTIRYFELILKILLGEQQAFEILGRNENKTICIKTNGNIEIVDSMKVCGDGFTNTFLNIKDNSFDESFKNEILKKYYFSHSDEMLCSICKSCCICEICGGGKLCHRYSIHNGFNNPSVYCQCIKDLIVHIQEKLFRDIPDIMNKCNITRLKDII